MPDLPLEAVDVLQHHFHSFLAAASWIPLPREAQVNFGFRTNFVVSSSGFKSLLDALLREFFFLILAYMWLREKRKTQLFLFGVPTLGILRVLI